MNIPHYIYKVRAVVFLRDNRNNQREFFMALPIPEDLLATEAAKEVLNDMDDVVSHSVESIVATKAVVMVHIPEREQLDA